MEVLLNKLGDMLLGLECPPGKVLATTEDKARRYSELLATSIGPQNHPQNTLNQIALPGDGPPQTFGLIVKAADSNISSHEANILIKEAVDPKALKLEVCKPINLANNAVLLECKSKPDREILEKEFSKLGSHRRTPEKEAPNPTTNVHVCA
jgi:hypothetical protein